jgi:hypothetical protein
VKVSSSLATPIFKKSFDMPTNTNTNSKNEKKNHTPFCVFISILHFSKGNLIKFKKRHLKALNGFNNILGIDTESIHYHVARSGETKLISADDSTIKTDILIP